MPRNTAGIYSLPPGYEAVTGQTIEASQHNPPLEDLAQALTGSLARNGSAPMLADLPMGGRKVTGLADGTADADAVSLSQLQSSVAAVTIPLGGVVDFAGATPPDGWFLCYGQAISRTTYAALYAVLSTRYGAGDGTTTFNLPDLRGRVAAGVDNMGGPQAGRLTSNTVSGLGTTLGGVGGNELYTLSQSNIPNYTLTGGGTPGSHSHLVPRYASLTNIVNGGGFPTSNLWQGETSVSSSETPITGITINSGGSGAAFDKIQPTILLNKIIRAV